MRDKERKRNINMCLLLACPLLWMWPATQACALTGTGTRDLLLCGATPSPLSHWPGQVSDFISHPVCAGLTAACVDWDGHWGPALGWQSPFSIHGLGAVEKRDQGRESPREPRTPSGRGGRAGRRTERVAGWLAGLVLAASGWSEHLPPHRRQWRTLAHWGAGAVRPRCLVGRGGQQNRRWLPHLDPLVWPFEDACSNRGSSCLYPLCHKPQLPQARPWTRVGGIGGKWSCSSDPWSLSALLGTSQDLSPQSPPGGPIRVPHPLSPAFC